MTVQAAPRSTVDIFSEEVFDNPYPHYKDLRDTASVVYLEKLDAYAISRYDDVMAALKDWQTFGSTEGTSFNSVMNSNLEGVILTMEPPEHKGLRTTLLQRLRLSSVKELAGWVNEKAESMITPLIERGQFDIVTDLAYPFPSQVVGELIGLRPDTTDQFVIGSDAVFAAMGPMNERTETALGIIGEVLQIISQLNEDDLAPGSMGAALYQAAARGDIPEESIVKLLWNYAGPAFDTTIQGINNVLWLLATHPDQLELLREDPSLIPSACYEALRVEPPIQIWSRFCREDTTVGDQVVPANSRVAVLLGSANRDERHYDEPEKFDVRRNPKDLLSFGYGIHTCVGAALARLELEAVLKAFVPKVRTIEVRDAVRHLNNTVRGFRNLPVVVNN
jgi:cytochrome P450